MANFLNHLKKLWQDEKHDALFDLADVASVWPYRPTQGRVVLETITNILRLRIRRLVCRVIGHNKVSDGFAGPDSGYIGLYCTRCGWSVGEYLY